MRDQLSSYPRNLADTSSNAVSFDVIDDVMGSLPAVHSEILILICIKDKSYEEASLLLKIPVNSVRIRLSEARENFHSSLKNSLMVRKASPEIYLHPERNRIIPIQTDAMP